jgi:aspartyl-tRNA(Asn)/glutamyl-tRNA(Gln) amidotransferase subunit A
VRKIVTDAVKVFERDLGCKVEEANPGWGNPYEAFWGMVARETDLRGMRAMEKKLGDKMTPHVRDFLKTEWTAEQFTDAMVQRKAVNNKMWRFMRKYDLLLTPTLAVPPFEVGIQGPTAIDGKEVEPFEWLHFTYPLNLTGQPAATAPAGWTDDGLPVGLQIIGRHLGDAMVLRASACFEAARPWKHRWPPLLEKMGL